MRRADAIWMFLELEGFGGSFQCMTTLAQIESAVEALPRHEQRKLHTFLSRRLARSVKKQRQPSAHDLMKDGCGIIDSGIGDLSNKKKHLRLMGFGK